MKISILLPYKENFSTSRAGAVSLYVKDITVNSKFRSKIKIYGDTISKNKLLNNFIHIDTKSTFYLSKTKAYVNEFLKKEIKYPSDIIEIHNRPSYVIFFEKKINAKLILYFHNDPLSMKGSISLKERNYLLNKCEKIVFNSHWCKSRFLKGLDETKYRNDLLVIPQSTSKTKINFKNKENIISFIGKLNQSKGYDSFGSAIVKILNEFKDWKSIVIGDEPRQKFFFEHKNLILYGFKKNSFILNKLKKVSISVVPSKWDEPFGRSSLEASSRGCALIISNKGGLPETTNHAISINVINKDSIYKSIKKLILNSKLRSSLQKKTYNNFYLTNKYCTQLIDNLRSSLINLSNVSGNNLINKKLKILHITNFNERFNGRLHYNTGKRLTNGFIRLGHNVLSLSDRDILNRNKKLTDPNGVNILNDIVLKTHLNFKADIIVLGHVDNIKIETINKLKKINNVKICQWFLDPLIKNGPDFNKNKKRILSLNNLLDSTFLTTHPDALNFKIKNGYFIPNPCDKSFEILDNSKFKTDKDLFFAMSHGVHRGILKEGKSDGREVFLNKLSKRLKNINFDIFGMNNIQPIWGDDFIQNLKRYSMGLNLSRGSPAKYYTSDRIVQLMGNGLLTFIDKKTKLYEIINNNEAVFYTDINDLIKKINKYKNNPIKLKKIASNGKKAYFKKFNSNIICSFIINKTFNINKKMKFSWK